MSDMRDTRNDEVEGDVREDRDPMMNRDEEISREDMRARDREEMPDRERSGTDMPGREDTAREPVVATNRTDAGMWPEMGDLRQRFDAIQSEFIDDPKGAVNKAEDLIKDVVERITRSMHERMDTMHRGVESSDDTEQLRQTMRGYRDLVVWMDTRRAA